MIKNIFKKIPTSKATQAHRELLAVRDELLQQQRAKTGFNANGTTRAKYKHIPAEYWNKP